MRGNFLISILFIFAVAALCLTACRSARKTDLRTLAPRDALVYLETNDAAALLDALTAGAAFQTLADRKDYSALRGVQTAVVVSGFETAEKDSALNLKPRFVVIADTHIWNWQNVSLIENQLDAFVKRNFDAAAQYEKAAKDGGDFFIWTAQDKRQIFAFARDGLIYFGNDAAAIEKCLAATKGGENLAQNESFVRIYSPNNLAFGYVSNDGINQLAALAGVSVAVNSSEESDERSFIARILPQFLQNTTQEIIWTANRAENGIEDNYAVTLKPETSAVLKEVLVSEANTLNDFVNFLPSDVFSTTRYNLKNPLVAWRGSVSLAARNADELSGKILNKFSDKLLEPYGVAEAEKFLDSISAPVVTAQFDASGERSVTIATVKDSAKLKDSLVKEINFNAPPEKQANAEIWFSEDKNFSAAFVKDKIILGDSENVAKCLTARQSAEKFTNNRAFQRFAANQNVAATFGTDADSAEKFAGVLGHPKSESRKLATFYTTETRLTEKGFERVTVSDFGFVGTILKNLN